MTARIIKSTDYNQQVRAFIAIELPEELKLALVQLQTELKSARQSFVKWVVPEGIHLTLKFLGNIATDNVSEIIKAINQASKGIPPFRVETTDLGVFPNLRKPRVLWLGIDGNLNTLINLQKHIDDVMEPMGFLPERRAFTPHLTLARIRENASLQDRREFSELIDRTHADIKCKIEVNSISLMKSQLLSGGAVYTCLDEVKLVV